MRQQLFNPAGLVGGQPVEDVLVWFKSGHHSSVLFGKLSIGVGLNGREVPDGFEQAMVVEP